MTATPPVSPRFAGVVPPNFTPRPRTIHTGEDPANPDEFPTRELNGTVDPNPDGTPKLAAPEHHVTPLDLARAADIVRERAILWDGKDADETPFTDTPAQYVVRDHRYRYSFPGVRLAYVSSETTVKPRWTEIEIYRTEGGLWITHRVAVTTVAHVDNCAVLRRYHKTFAQGVGQIASDEMAPADRTACPECIGTNRRLHDMLHEDPASIKFERDRHQVSISETPESAIQTLHTTKRGVKNLGSLAASAIQMASDRSPHMAAVFYGTPK